MFQKQHNPRLIQLMQPDLFVRNIFRETVVLFTEQDIFILMLEFDGEFSMKSLISLCFYIRFIIVRRQCLDSEVYAFEMLKYHIWPFEYSGSR